MRLTLFVPDRASAGETIAEVQRVFGAAGYMARMSSGALVVDPMPSFLAREPESVAEPEAMPANVQRIDRRRKRA